jgi:hypothetical protein
VYKTVWVVRSESFLDTFLLLLLVLPPSGSDCDTVVAVVVVVVVDGYGGIMMIHAWTVQDDSPSKTLKNIRRFHILVSVTK